MTPRMTNARANLPVMKAILVVDDSDTVRQQLRFVLQASGYVILEAADGLQALAVIKQCKVALIICDVNMPRMNGLELLERLEPRKRSIPVLMLSVEGNAVLLDRARRAGATGWIIKPFKAELLIKEVHALLSR